MQSEYSVENKTMVRTNVKRLDGGVYECTFEETDNFQEISGRTKVSVNCKCFTLDEFFIKYILPVGSLFDLYALFLCLCVQTLNLLL